MGNLSRFCYEYFIENVKGTNSIYVTKDGTTAYCYKKSDNYYYATESKAAANGDGIAITHYYYTTDSADATHYNADTKRYYDLNYCYFLSSIGARPTSPRKAQPKRPKWNCSPCGSKTADRKRYNTI